MMLYQKIAQLLNAIKRCKQSNNEYAITHEQELSELCDNLPGGSGIDNGTHLMIDQCTDKKLVFKTSFHYMVQ